MSPLLHVLSLSPRDEQRDGLFLWIKLRLSLVKKQESQCRRRFKEIFLIQKLLLTELARAAFANITAVYIYLNLM